MTWQEIIADNELDVSIIRWDQLFVDNPLKRIDSNYFSRFLLEKEERIENKSCQTIAGIATSVINFGAYSLTNLIEFLPQSEGVPYLNVGDIRDGWIMVENAKHIKSELSSGALEKFLVQEGQVVLTIAGTIGEAAVVHEVPQGTNSNQAIAKITLNQGTSPYYLATYLNSSYGRSQAERLTISSVQANLLLTQVKQIKVAIPSAKLQKAIERLCLDAYKMKSNAADELDIAKKKLLFAIGLSNYQPLLINISARLLSDAKAANRFDAEYWQPKYDEVETHIKNVSHATFGDIFAWKKGVEVGSEAYQEQGISFIRISNLDPQELTNNDQKCISPELYADLKDSYAPRKGEILFSKDGTAGIAHHLTDDIEGVISGGILRLTIKDKNIDPDYLTACLNSLAIQMQVERYCGGSIIQHLKTDDAEKILIPLLNQTQQKAIAEGARVARKKLKEAKALIDCAKRAVEVFIEKDENAALKILNVT